MDPFIPDDLPLAPAKTDAAALLAPLAAASRALARYDGALMHLRNPGLLLSPLMNNEAVLSSRIEGTQATLGDLYEADADAEPEEGKRDDILEIRNYRAAIQIGIESASQRGLTLSLLRELHQRLMTGVRGGDKRPGAFRNDQNWIGARGCSIDEARFVPPNPVVMVDALANWESYIASGWRDPIIGAAIAHAQFEIIHPFNDGNGRVGRMIIPLMLAQTDVIQSPNFYVSSYFEKHREEYYDRLLAISNHGAWTEWIIYFCNAVVEQSRENLERVQTLKSLYDEMSDAFVEATHSQHALSALNTFFARPVITGPQFQRSTGITHRPNALKILNQLEEAGLITCVRRGSGRRPSRYAMASVIAAAEGLLAAEARP
ncbi:MAG: Fic family protein [Alphaproteobacteria bacterium]|nr:Fic family protein [Alphaproteobacteria bacterium]